jgi:hypothetical protein
LCGFGLTKRQCSEQRFTLLVPFRRGSLTSPDLADRDFSIRSLQQRPSGMSLLSQLVLCATAVEPDAPCRFQRRVLARRFELQAATGCTAIRGPAN